MGSNESPNSSLLKVPILVENVVIEGKHYLNTSYLQKVTTPVYDCQNLQELLNATNTTISELNYFEGFKDIKVSLEEANQVTDSKIPITVKFLVNEKTFGIKTGVEISNNEPSMYFGGQLFNIANHINRLSVRSNRGIHNIKPLEVVYDSFVGPLKSSLGVVFNAKDNHGFFAKTFSSAYLNLCKQYGTSNISLLMKLDDSALNSSRNDISYNIRKRLNHVLSPSIGITTSRSLLDNNMLPTSGSKLESLINYTILPFAENILRAQVRYQTHLHYNCLTISGYLLGGLTVPRGTIGMLDERYYCGGQESTRCFKFNGIGTYVDGYNIGSENIFNYSLCLSHNFMTSLRNKVSAGIYYCNSFMSNSFNLSNWQSNSSVGVFLAANISERARLEVSYGIPLQVSDKRSVLSGLQLGLSLENWFS